MAKRKEKSGENGALAPTSPNGAADFIPATPSLDAARDASAACRGCNLYRRATQTVFGEGAEHARVMLVGETPGDREDVVGRPFVGPAGQLLAAGQALFGSRFSVTRERGRFLASKHAPFVLATLHPSALLRIREADARREAFEHFVADLALIHDAEREPPS